MQEEQNRRIICRYKRNKYQNAKKTEPGGSSAGIIGTSTRLPEEHNRRIIYRYNRNKYQTARGT
jgi:hypothetical protein